MQAASLSTQCAALRGVRLRLRQGRGWSGGLPALLAPAPALAPAGRGGSFCVRAESGGAAGAGAAGSAAPAAAGKVAGFVDHAPFSALGLAEIYEKVGGIRTRQHVNPLKRELQVPAPAPDWRAAFADPSLPLALDIGCGSGRFPLMLGRRELGRRNCLGLDIRGKLVDRATKWAATLQAPNVAFALANATVSLDTLLAGYPGVIDLVTIQFPDPHFKVRHRKRRVVQPAMVAALARALKPGAIVMLQSDVEGVAAHMRDAFELHGGDAFELAPAHSKTTADGGASPAPAHSAASADVSFHVATYTALFGPPPDAHAAAAASLAAALLADRGAPARADDDDEGETDGEGEEESDVAEARGGALRVASGPALPRGGAAAGARAGPDDSGEGPGGATPAELALRLSSLHWWKAGWLPGGNPLGIPTEREVATLGVGGPVHRVLLVRR